MDRRTLSEEYANIGNELIEEMPELAPLKDANITIVYLSSEHRKKGKGKKICAQCEKVGEKYKWGIPADFTITVFEPNIEGFTDEQIRILLFHELLHIGRPDGTWTTVPHDLEDFKIIIDKYGTDWAKVEGKEQKEDKADVEMQSMQEMVQTKDRGQI